LESTEAKLLRGDPGRPVIPISIGMVDFPEALCDFGSSVNIMPRFPKGNIEEPPRPKRPFLNTSGAVNHASAAKISFYIKRKETFSFKNKITQISEQSRHEPRKRTNRRNRNKQMWTKSAKMVRAVQGGQDRRLKSPFLTKRMTQSPINSCSEPCP